jgi:sugar lactone lactonase YvrE
MVPQTLNAPIIPVDMAFDPNGNGLWVLDSVSDSIIEFPMMVTGDLSPVASLFIYDNGSNWIHLNGASFDPSGNLWVTAQKSSTVVKLNVLGINTAEVDGGVLAAPVATLRTTDGGSIYPFNKVASLTFDAKGDLWVVNAGDTTLVHFASPSQLTSGVAPKPASSFTGVPGVDVGRMQFNPPARGQGLFP